MKKIRVTIAVLINGVTVDGFKYGFLTPNDSTALKKEVKELTHYLLALLEILLVRHANNIQVGQLTVKISCGEFHNRVVDICGGIPENIAEITRIFSENMISDNIRDVILDSILSAKI